VTLLCRQGRLVTALEGEGELAARIRAELETLAAEDGEPQLRFRVVDAVSPGGFHASLEGFEYRAEPDDAGVGVQVRFDVPHGIVSHLPESLARFLNWNYLAPRDKLAKNFIYDVFDHLCQVVQLGLGQSYLHASAFCNGARAVALVAEGGVGKTTSVLKFVLEGGWRYLGDDLVALDESGTLWRTPKRMQVYGYNLEGQDALTRQLLCGRTQADRISWAWHRRKGGHKVRRRVAARDLLGADRIADSARATDVIYLQRGEGDRFEREPIAPDALAQRAAVTLLHELKPLSELIAAAGADFLPGKDEFIERTAAVLARGMRDTNTRIVTIPVAATPDALYAFLQSELAG